MEHKKHYTGLTNEQVIESRKKYGNNLLTPPKRDPLWKLFLEKFEDPIIRILLIAAFLSLGIAFVHQEFAETIGIFCAIFLATGVAFWFEMDAKLTLTAGSLTLVRVDSLSGKRSKTVFEVTEKFSGYTALRCFPKTSRTHQIRVHLRHAGFPIVGDTLYGGKPLWLSRLKKDFRLKPGREERALISRVALHAEQLSLTHPVTQQPVVISAPLPKDLRVALRYLREFRGGGPRPDEPGD